MNRIYRLVWSESLHAFVPAAELARRRGKRSGGGRSVVGGLVMGGLVASALSPVAHGAGSVGSAGSAVAPNALPTAPQVTVGQATVASKGNQMQVTETSSSAAINWGSFNIGSAAGVTFVQPTSTSVVLNRVLSADPSQIYGTLKANGIVFLINPQGVVVGQGAEVNVGGLVASSLNISDKDFAAGNWSFTGSGAPGTVSNAGAIHVAPGGFVALLGSKIDNSGSIDAKLGSVAFAAGKKVTLDLDNSGLLKVGVDQAAVDALVQNSGAVLADGGRIILTAKSANDVLGTVVNNTGVLQAQTVGLRDGQVWLLAADPLANTGANGSAANGGAVQDAAGAVVSSGKIDVSGDGAAGAGEATLAGTTVALTGSIDASNSGGSAGRVLLNSTQATTLAAGSSIDVASAAAGGKVVAWSDGETSAHGEVDGRGLGADGSAATVEMSSAHGLGFDADVRLNGASAAKSGTLILDPATLEIAPGSGSAANTVYQSPLQTQAGNVVLSATGQITVDALTNNVLNLANATSLSITSQSSGGIAFLNGAGGVPSGITTHNAPVTLNAAGSGSLENVGQITTNGGDITLSGVFVHLAGGLDATAGQNPAGNVALSVFGGGILSSSAAPLAGGQVLLDATYGYIGAATAPVPTSTGDLTVKTGGNAYIANTGSLSNLALASNHLEGTPVGIDITASNLQLTGADAVGDGTMYSTAVRWTSYSANNPGSVAGPSSVSIVEDGNLLPSNINLPQTALTLTSNQGYIMGGNVQPVIANTLTLASSLGIGGTDINGVNAEDDLGIPGNSLLTHAGTVTANVLDPSGNITGIANLTAQGNLLGTLQASQVLLQASGNIGSPAQHFAVDTGTDGEVFNVAAGGNINLDVSSYDQVIFDNVQSTGYAAVQSISLGGGEGGANVFFHQASAGGNLTITGVQVNDLQVSAATSTNGSIAITNDGTLEVDAATLNGTDAANRFIDLTSNNGSVAFGLISTNGPTGSAAASAPLGSINIGAPQGYLYDLAAWEDPPPSVLRAANATLTALYNIDLANTGVDTYTALTMTAGAPGSYSGTVSANLVGIDSVNDPNGNAPHAIHLVNATSYSGNLNVTNSNGDLDIGSVRSIDDCGGGCSYPGTVYLTASGSIVADGSVGGGRITASDLSGHGGYILLNAGGSLGTRGTGSDGTVGASYLSVSANGLDFTTHGDLFINNDEGPLNVVNLHLGYASSTSPYFYHFDSQLLTNPASVTFNAASSAGLLTVSSATAADNSGTVNLYADGDIRVQSWQSGALDVLGIYGHNISIDAPVDNTPALSMGDTSTLSIQAQGTLTVGNLASTGVSAGDSMVDLEAYGGNLTLGKVSAANADVTVYATNGDILGSAGNQVLAHNLTLNNSFGAIGADPALNGSIPITVGVSHYLNVTNENGGGSINLITLNDPAVLNLTLNTPASSAYVGANFLIAPSTTGLGLSGSAVNGAVTLATLGTTGTSASAVQVNITADTPSITINSGAGPQLGIGYNLYFGSSYPSVAANLAGSAGETVVVHTDNSSSTLTSLTGTVALTDLQIDSTLYSSGGPLTVNFTLANALQSFTLQRDGSNYDPTSFNGSSYHLTGSGQALSAVETSGVNGSAPGVMTLNGASATALDLTVNLLTAGVLDVGTINFGALGAVNLSATTSSLPFSGVASALEGVSGNSISAGAINLSALGDFAGQATLGTSGTPLNVNAPNVALASSGDIYLTTGGTLSSLAISVSHPRQDTSGNYTGNTANYVYSIGGSTSLIATDDAADTATALSFTSATPVNFSFATDRTINVGSISAGAAGSVTLTTNGDWTTYPNANDFTHIGIEQVTGSGITAGTVTLNANGYEGHAGTTATALDVATANLNISVDGDINVADSAALTSLALTLTHGNDPQLGYAPDHSYAVTAPNIALTLLDQYNEYGGYVGLLDLESASLQKFSLNVTNASISVGNYNSSTADYTGGQIALGNTAVVSLTSAGSIWQDVSGGTSNLSDAATGAVADTAVIVKVGTLNLSAVNDIIMSANSGEMFGQLVSLPIEVGSLSVISGGEAAFTNIGNLNVTSASISGSGYFRAVETAPGSEASLTGGSLATPLAAADLQLVAYYGNIGSSAAPVITNTTVLGLDSGANIYAADQAALTTLSIISHHNKASIGDTSNGGLNALGITDTSTTGGTPLQLGVTDLGAAAGYQLTGLVAPQLNFSFETDNGISAGTLTAASVALNSEHGSILHIPAGGTITAATVALTASTPGQSVGAAGNDVLVAAPTLSVSTGGNMYVADAATLASLRFNIGSVTDLGTTPVYQLDNSGAPNPLTFNVSADTAHNLLDVNSIAVSRTDAPVLLTVYSLGSGIGVNQISDNRVSGGEVDVWSDSSGNVFGLGATPAGISATTVSLIARDGSIGTSPASLAAPVVVLADTVTALSSGDLRITSPQTITNLTLQEYDASPTAGATWAVTTAGFSLNGTVNNSGVLDVANVSGSTTNLEVDSAATMTIGTLALGSASLNLNAYYNSSAKSIDSDGSNGNAANITTTGDVTLSAYTGIGGTTQIKTNIGGALSLANYTGGIDIDQISNRDLTISALSQNPNDPTAPVSITSAGNLFLTSGASSGYGPNSSLSLTAGGDINWTGQAISLNHAPLTLSAGGSIVGGDITGAAGASLVAAGTATGSSGSLTIGSLDTWYYSSYAPITLQALGDINIGGQVVSQTSVSVMSTNGSIYGQGASAFAFTPVVTLSAAGDIGYGSAGSIGPWQLNGQGPQFPGTLTLSAQAGGQINLASYAAVDVTHLTGGGNVSLQVWGDNQGSTPQGISFGQVSSAGGSVYLGTANGDITASGAGSAITAATSINLTASQSEDYYSSNLVVGQAFNLGSSLAPLSLTAPQISLTANGNIYATVPTNGLTDLSVARTYVPYDSDNPSNQTLLMPAGIVLIKDPASDTVLSVVDGGWASGNLSAINASYGSALNLSYAGNNAIQLGTLTLDGGNLNLQATSPSNISITSTGGLVQANNFSFNLIDANGIDNSNGTANGGFGTALNPINTEITSLSGTTVGPTAGVFMNQIGAITFANLSTGGDIVVTTTRASGAPGANADIAIGSVTSNGGSVTLFADGAIIAANGVTAPSVTANGPSNDGDVSLTAAAGIHLPSSTITSNLGNVSLIATGGDVTMGFSTISSNGGNIDVAATAGNVALTSASLDAVSNIDIAATVGTIMMDSSIVMASSGDLTVHAGNGLDLMASALQSFSGGSVMTLTADTGDLTLGAINASGSVDVTATTGAIKGTTASLNLTQLFNGITAGSDITLTAAAGIGTAAVPVTVMGGSDNIITANTTRNSGNVYLVTGGPNYAGSPAVLEANVNGSLNVANFFNTLTLDDVQAAGNINVTQQNYYGNIVLNNVIATGPGTTFTFVAPYGNIVSENTDGVVSASRIVLNALGDPSGGSLGQNYSPVNVDAEVVIAVASNDISLNSVATGATKMPLVASNGFSPTVSISSAGDFLVGQIVGGQEGTVNINSAGNIFDDGDTTTQIYAGTVNLTAVDAIGTAQTPISMTAAALDSGITIPGTISAASTTAGNIYLAQTGAAIMQSLTAADGSINVSINDPTHGQSTLVYADTTATDQTGNDINVTITGGDLTIDVAQAGMTAGTVNLTATTGSLYGDGRADCCTNPNVSGDTVNLTAQNNIGAISDLSALTGTALGIQANQSTATTSANNSQIYIQYVGNATVGSAGPNLVSPLGTSTEVLLAACGDLTLAGLTLPGVSLGLNAGTAGSGGSVLDGINGGASLTTPDVTAASIVFGAATNVGDPAASLWVNTPILAASAADGGVWINDAATAPVHVTAVTAGNGPVVIGGQGDLLLGSIDAGAGSGSATLTSATGGVLDGVTGGASAGAPNITAGAVTVNAATNSGSASDALWVNTPTVTAASGSGGVWINDAATSTVTVSSVTTNGGPVVIGSQGDLSVVAVNAGSGSATLNSASGAVVDGISGGSNAANPNVIAGSVAVNASTHAGNASDPLWVDAAVISGSATTGGVWINDAATTPVTVASITSGTGPVVIGGQGNLLIDSINAGSGSATLTSAGGAILDGVTGGASAGAPNITAGAVTVNAATNSGSASDALWVNTPTVTAASGSGGVWINDAATSTVTVSSVTTNGGPVVIGSQGDLSVVAVNAGSGSATLNSASGAVVDGISGGSNAANPNVIAGSVAVNASTHAGNASDPLWVDAAVISGSATTGGVWINDAATTPVTVASITSGTGPVVIGGQGNLLIDSINAGSGSATLTSAGGSVLDGIAGGSNASNPNVTAGAVTVNSAIAAGNASDPLWVDAAVISGSAATGGVWINDAATTPVTVASITSVNGPVVIGGQGNLLIDSINAGSGSATLTSATGSVLDGIAGGSNASNPNVTAGAVTVNSAIAAGNASNALWVNALTITATAANGGVWINDAATTPVTAASITTSNGPVVIGSQGNLLVDSVNAGSGSATLNSASGAVVDGISGGSNASNPNVTAGAVTVNSALNAGNASDALWVNAAVISGSATSGGVWINDAATTPVTVASITTGNGPVMIGAQGNLLIDSIAAGSGSATLTSVTGAILDGVTGGSNAGNPNVIASAVTVNSATDVGSASDALWVNAPTITAAATTGGVWINDASRAPVTVSSVTTNGGPVVIGSQGELAVVAVNAGSGSATLNSATGAVVDGVTGSSNAAHPNVIAGAVIINSAGNGGSATDALWVDAPVISGSSTTGGVWINDAATTPVIVASMTTGNGPVVIGAQGNLLIDSINAGSGSATLTSATGAVLDGVTGGSSANLPNVTAAAVTVNSAVDAGNASDALWVNAAVISGSATSGGVWINDAATTPVTVASMTTGNGPVVIGARGNLYIDTINAGSASATLTSATGSVLDGMSGGSSADRPNVTAGAVTVNSARNGGSASDALWVNAAAISGSATTGGVWINDSATTPVTVASITTGNGPVVIGARGDLAIDTINAGSGDATLTSAAGAVIDGLEGGSSAAHPNVTAASFTVDSAAGVGSASDSLWVNTAALSASTTAGGVWINDASVKPVNLVSVTTVSSPIVIGGEGTLVLGRLGAGGGDVTLTSSRGSILDGVSGHSNNKHPNVVGGTVTLTAAGTIGTLADRVYVSGTSIVASASAQFINDPPTPYPYLPLLDGVSPVTVYMADAQAHIVAPQQLPITLIGQPLRGAPPIAVTADSLGILLPVGVDSNAAQQDTTMGTTSTPILGGNDEEIGRKKAAAKAKRKRAGSEITRNLITKERLFRFECG